MALCVAARTLLEPGWKVHPQECPVCGARDAFTDTVRDGDEYYVECVNCQIYLATRRAYRLFQYLRARRPRQP
jgi:predicted RNA-binding Zn-ribbon protein involved in translation (DUF1610 family)